MDSGRALASQLDEGVNSIVPVLDIVKLVESRSNANGRGNVIPGRLPPSAGRIRQVAFIRLDRSERGENVVFTHAEKYNIARSIFDPFIDRLSRLSSAKFYRQLQGWEEKVRIDSGPERNLADVESCPSASQVSLDALDVSELSQTVISGGAEVARELSIDTSEAAMSLLACAAGRSRKDTLKDESPHPDEQVSLVKLNVKSDPRAIDDMNLQPHIE
ncbi:hypothetical protein PHMEG_00012314 [Phytophthora megakarya]|uniref:Uncharacterized protein n=1 Tax=Phytophthora megakarya TaxID=4795 RepID=A0A225W911_9STRA|nr:hypothetical protein PHMEG_00012314 [Phytophthora megakarya]